MGKKCSGMLRDRQRPLKVKGKMYRTVAIIAVLGRDMINKEKPRIEN